MKTFGVRFGYSLDFRWFRRHPQLTLILTPLLLLLSTCIVFRVMGTTLGKKRGYLAGFLFYWIFWCVLMPLHLLGPRGVMGLFRTPRMRFTSPKWVGVLLLTGPTLAPLLSVFPAAVRRANRAILRDTALFSLVNGTLEELLWRGTYSAIFPTIWWWGYLYPSLGFGLWHFAPQSLQPYTGVGGAPLFAFAAVFMGLSFGWVAVRTQSLRWTALAHIFNNAVNLGGSLFHEETAE